MRRRVGKRARKPKPSPWTKPLRFSDLQADDVFCDNNGRFFRVIERQDDVYKATYQDVIVPRYVIKGIFNNDWEMSGAGQRPHWEFSGVEGGAWVWHSRLGCLIL